MPLTPIAASIAVLPPAGMPAAPAPGMPSIGIPARTPPEADAGRDIDTDGWPPGFAPIATAGAAPIGACRQSKSDAERQDESAEDGFHARKTRGTRRPFPAYLRQASLIA
jgi:hypothetical protein